MRLRSFTARTMPDAMALVRQHLGPDAIILSTRDAAGMIEVTAALDRGATEGDGMAAMAGEPAAGASPEDPVELIEEVLHAHGVPAALVEALLTGAAEHTTRDPVAMLAGVLGERFPFAPLGECRTGRPVMLVGPPGAGKTVTLAKLATRILLAGRRPWVVTCDMVRAGGMAQLQSLMRVLDLPLLSAGTADELAALLASAGDGAPILIDSAGINPYRGGEREELAALIAAADAEPVLVMPAGGDVIDQVEAAHVFRALGCTRLVATRLDMVHRLGSLIAAVDEAQLAFADAGVTPDVAAGLTPFNPLALARFLLPEALGEESQPIAERIGS